MKTGDFVYIDYIGRIKETGEIFDLTKEDIARENGIYDPKFKYRPIPVIVDSDLLIKGLSKALKEMKIGEKKKVEIKASDAFGERKEELIKIVPESIFKEQNIEPTPGYFVSIGGVKGRIISVSGGRVKVDFNHPLAGKTLEYEIEIVKEVKDKEGKIKSIVCYFTGVDEDEINLEFKEKTVEISFKSMLDLSLRTKDLISRKIFEWVEGVEELKFVESFKKT
ncbi:MAG: FKBP-type peptidyl-prolyl cis-trans isomerase [Candidatus Aenigmatarchaeota archaeon]